MSWINYKDLGLTHTPHECSGLERVFVMQGLDRIQPDRTLHSTGVFYVMPITDLERILYV